MLDRQSADLSTPAVPDLDGDDAPFGAHAPTPISEHQPPAPPAEDPSPPPAQGPTTVAPPPSPLGGIELDFEFSSGTDVVSPGLANVAPTPRGAASSLPDDLFSEPPQPPAPTRVRPAPPGPSGGPNPDLSFFDDPGPLDMSPSLDSSLDDGPSSPHRSVPPAAAPELQLVTEALPPVVGQSPFLGTPQAAKPRRIEIQRVVEPQSVARVLLRGFVVLLLVVASLATFVLFKNDWQMKGDVAAMIAKAFGRSSVTRLGGSNTGTDISIGQVHRAIYENVLGRRLLIVGGSIEFTRKKPKSVVVKLVDHEAKLIAEKGAIVGRVFTAADLNRIADARSLEEADGRLRAGELGEVPAAGDGAFMAVFMPVPEGVENRAVWNEIDVVMGSPESGREREK